jgi:RNA polymerase subunit RPABC4/transcription elongation factor Spt4
MSRREEIEKLSQIAYESEDLPTLERTRQQLAQLLQSMRQNLQGTTDADVAGLLNELIEQAVSIDQDLKQKIAQIKVDMMDPSYAAQKAEREREKLAEQAKTDELTRKFQEGIGSLFGGLGGALGFGGGAQPASGSTDAQPAAAACGQCGAALGAGAKFCPDCGTPVPRERRCASCNAKLEAGAKFCPECGTRAA